MIFKIAKGGKVAVECVSKIFFLIMSFPHELCGTFGGKSENI